MTSRLRTSLWVLAGIAGIGLIVVSLGTVDYGESRPGLAVSETLWALVPASFAAAAAVIIAQQPRNSIGWVLLVPGALGLLDPLLIAPLSAMKVAPPFDPWLLIRLWADNFSWIFLVFPVFHLLLVFPTGRVVSERWRWLLGLEIGMSVTIALLGIFAQHLGPFTEDGETLRWAIENPIGFVPQELFDSPVFGIPWTAGLVVLPVAGVASMMIRFRRGGPVERQQIKLVLFAVTLFGVVYVPLAMFGGDFEYRGLIDTVYVLAFLSIPAAIVASVLRYRLFDIDVLIRRTILYALLAGLLAAAYFVLIAGLSSVLPSDDPLVVAVSTLAVAALFNPIRRRVHELLERRFNRSRYDRQVLVESFSGLLRNIVDPEALTDSWLEVVSKSMQPVRAGIWVRDREA